MTRTTGMLVVGAIRVALAACAGPQADMDKEDAAQMAYDIGLGALAEGNMTKAFAVIASPAEYGVSGIMTFMINRNGILFQKALGPKTQKLVAAIQQERERPPEDFPPGRERSSFWPEGICSQSSLRKRCMEVIARTEATHQSPGLRQLASSGSG